MDHAAAGPPEAQSLPGCYRHPDRETGIRCTRCERPICTDCMVNASVGFHCPDCAAGRTPGATGPAPAASRPRTLAGGTIAADPHLVTKILIGINVAVFIAVRALPDSFLADMVLIGRWPPAPFVPTEGVAEGEWYRLVTTMFTHQEIWHIGFNMVSLWFLGAPVEAALGRARYLALYLVSGLAGSVFAYLLTSPTTPVLGASGAIFGLFGATAALVRRLKADMRPVVILLVISLIFTFTRSNISWQAHVGGLVAGAVIGYAMLHAPRERRTLVQYGTCALVLVAVVGLTLLRTVQLT
ncbi:MULTISPECIES: rhomboid family intramembrane serine protease [Streptomyces]|uniref:rhomboid family intramembrane serine protease n=1 Tax=Streptomyces TaxID=1883 RepID=UPI001290B379|nr:MULTISPECIES: rhomboid family intramembrane serine protease [Streptomyces]KAF2778900.1 Peptidase S54, rhomboid domain protein [Streptomyces sp. OM5714]MCX5036644.1 rhomboid family intramembrane serine protease [Streptomyces coelicoflavus]MDI6514907.1 rhomboid family intramembrane serine protease [Streptomyces coelicoflavus]NHI08472.1 Peptidase S54, rhomboid domain protein [Streptomyces sp. KO7888]QFX82837.1 rhomboid family intramembrane serine protease [Streptomyces sp. SYP-A7193]